LLKILLHTDLQTWAYQLTLLQRLVTVGWVTPGQAFGKNHAPANLKGSSLDVLRGPGRAWSDCENTPVKQKPKLLLLLVVVSYCTTASSSNDRRDSLSCPVQSILSIAGKVLARAGITSTTLDIIPESRCGFLFVISNGT